MIRLIAQLIERGHAYPAEGHVLFDVPSMADYGRLSNRSLDEMLAGARVDVAPYKRDAMDFVLWKPSKPGEPSWPSPWGPGRPGWHIECSAMSGALLGDVFDIHGGGIDLVFPHHENEIAQSRCAHGTPLMARYWLHNGFLQVEGEKMSKSLGNFVTINQVLKDWPGEVVRLSMLKTHYRQPIDWTVKALEESERSLSHWSELTAGVVDASIPGEVQLALEDDLNTPRVIAELHALASRKSVAELVGALDLIGVSAAKFQDWKAERSKAVSESAGNVDGLIAARAAARKAKDFKRADEIRAELDAMGIALKDAKDPATGELVTTWEVKR
jgi:cysteinyl-tRNA synthetase